MRSQSWSHTSGSGHTSQGWSTLGLVHRATELRVFTLTEAQSVPLWGSQDK